MKKSVRYLLLLFAMMLLAAGCTQEAKPQGFSSTDGLAVTATDDWTRVSDTQALYSTAFAADGQNGIDLALTDGKGQYFAIERYDCREQMADVVRLVNALRAQAEAAGEAALLAELTAQGADEATLAQYQKLLQCPAGGEEALYLTLADEAWHGEMAGLVADYATQQAAVLTLLGTETPLYEYSYTNADGQKLHGYEAALIREGKLYTFNGWTTEKQFAKSGESLQAIMQSVVLADQ